MKSRSIYYIILICILCLQACDRSIHRSPTILLVEKVMNEYPDSARVLLAKLKGSIHTENKATRMYYNLLTVKANDKCYITHTSDSLMLDEVDYYEHHGTPKQLMEAYYLMGRVYCDMGFTAKSLKYFHKTLDTKNVDNRSTYSLRAHAYNQIGQIYMYQNIFKGAMPFFIKTYQYSCLANDTSLIIYALRDIGRNYQSQGKTRTGIPYYKKAVFLSSKIENEYLKENILNELSILYRTNKDYGKAKSVLSAANGFTKAQDLSPHYINWGDLYLATNQIDSAAYYYKKCLTFNDLYNSQAASLLLYQIYIKKNNYKQAIKYLYNCLLYTDSLKENSLTENRDLIHSFNNKLQIEKENQILKQKQLHQTILFLCIALLLSFIAFYIFTRNRKRVVLLNSQKERLNQIIQEQYQKSLEFKEKNEKTIIGLNREIEQAHKQNDSLQENLLRLQKESIENTNRQLDIQRKKQKTLEESFKETQTYTNLRLAAQVKAKVTPEDWAKLTEYLNQNYNRFTERLTALCPSIKKKEMQVCCLIKLYFPNADIARILLNSPQAIANIRKRLYERIFQEEGISDDFDNFLERF